jgi:hypothetical protein
MADTSYDTTASAVSAVYEEVVSLAISAAPSGRLLDDGKTGLDLAGEAKRMRERFQKRTGAFGANDPWFETRSRAFWDDALTTQGFASLAAAQLAPNARPVAVRFEHAHRGLFVVDDMTSNATKVVDLWSGAELYIEFLDDEQATSLYHAEGLMDARVVRGPSKGSELATLYMLPGALHHGPDATAAIMGVLDAARSRSMQTGDVLDALLRMELVFRRSSRVKAAFAYRAEALSRVL